MNRPPDKDPKRQWQGKKSRNYGKRFEERLDAAFEYYQRKGLADIEKTPEPMRPIKNLGDGRFVAVYVKKAQADYKGTVKGGRTYVFEAKYTEKDRLEQSRVTEEQTRYLDRHQELGARCFILAGFSSGDVYRVPWDVWKNMKEAFGRKYVTERDLNPYRVYLGWNSLLQLI